MASLNKEKISFLKIVKGYKDDEPALVDFDTLVELIETKDNALDKIQELENKNKKLQEQLKTERTAHANEVREYLLAAKELEKKLDLSNTRASTFLAADAQRKIEAKKEKEKLKRIKIFSKTDLMLGGYYE